MLRFQRREATPEHRLRWLRTIVLLVVAGLSAPAASPGAPRQAGDEPLERRLFSGRTYDREIPSPTEFLGYGPGRYHTTYGLMVAYLKALAARSDRLELAIHGRTYERRDIVHAVISSPSNLARVGEIRERLARLAHPGSLDDGEGESIVAATPAAVFLVYGTHGDETAGPEAAMHTAYQLVAAADPASAALLDELVVVILPVLNPDGRERFVAWYNANQVGPEGSDDPDAAEHFAPWGVSTTNNHYQINLNREAAWSTQVEAQAMVGLYMDWNPQVFVDHHGNPEEFIGPWNAEPLNPEITPNQRQWMVRFGEAMAATFADHGFRYTPWEFGLMYPGYWDSFPLLTGAIAFTLESGGGGWKGIRLRTPAGHVTTFEDGVVQHLIADQSVLETTATAREQKLRDFLEYKRTAIAEAASRSPAAWVLAADNDPERLDRVVNLLRRNDIDVLRTREGFELEGAAPYLTAEEGPESTAPGAPGGDAGTASIAATAGREARFPTGGRSAPTRAAAGSYILPAAQPQARLLRVLMSPDTVFPAEYLRQVEENRTLAATPGFLNPNIWTTVEPFYDVTAWSIPLTYQLRAWSLPQMPAVETEPVDSPVHTPGDLRGGQSTHAFVFDYASNRAIAAIGWLRRQGIAFHVATSPFRIGEQRFVRGAIVVYRHENPQVALPALMSRLVDETGISVLGVDRNLTDEGPHLGSDQFVEVVQGRIGVVVGGPVRPSSFGEIWFLMERVYGIEFTALELERLKALDLRRFDVLVFPDGFYSGVGGEAERELAQRLRRWVHDGGSLVALKGAAAWFARPEMGLTSVRTSVPYVGKSIFMTDGGHPPLPPPYREADAPARRSGSPERGAGAEPQGAGAEPQGAAASTEQLTVQTTPLVPGAIFRARIHPHHYLSYGYDGELPVMIWSNLSFTTTPEVAVPVYFTASERALVAGFAFPDSVQRLEGSGYLMDEPRGQGHVILFADDPNFRLYWDGLTRLFFNSLLFSSSF